MSLETNSKTHWTRRAHRAKTEDKKNYKKLQDIFVDLAELLRPPERITITQAAEKYVKLNNPGSYIGPYDGELAPYMREPSDTLASRVHTGCVFVGPAQCGKTESLILSWVTYSIKVDPMDMIIYNPTTSAARDFSMRRIDRLHRHSPEVGKLLLGGPSSDNKFDKHYRSGMMLNLSWPSVTEFAGRPIGRVAMTDYDRMPDDVDGDGNPYDLASKRTTSFRSFAMTLAESSPSRDVEDPKWIKTTPHEAPPSKGILGLYNRGDRRKWYWPCPHCDSYFEGKWSLLQWKTKDTILGSAETVKMICPVSGCEIDPKERNGMNRWGQWLRDGQFINPQTGEIEGVGVRSPIASFWMNGTAAAFTTWVNLVTTYLTAQAQLDRTGSEEELKKFFNTDLGEPYIPKSADTERLPEVMKSRAEKLPFYMVEETEERIHRDSVVGAAIQPMVPNDVRCLIATVDVQTNMFVVQVHGVAPGEPYDLVLIDRFGIRKSRRLDLNGEHLWVKPAAHLEDWEEVTSEVIHRMYPLADRSGRKMAIKLTLCDSGGAARSTSMAYNYQRSLKLKGLAGRFHLLKGDGLATRPRTQITFPDANQKDKLSSARGDVPVMLMNSNVLKDALNGRLENTQVGRGMFRYPSWLPDYWYSEMCAEVRTDKGWVATNYRRNEAWDLSYYALGACASVILRIEGIDWRSPPGWAQAWDLNDLIVKPAQEEVFARPSDVAYDFANLGKALA